MTTPTTTRPRNTIHWEPTGSYVRFPCIVCGGWTDREDLMAVATAEDGSRLGIVCHECVKSDDIPARLIEYASDLEDQARQRREKAGESWIVPEFHHASLPPLRALPTDEDFDLLPF